MARRAIWRATQHKTSGGSANPKFSAFCPSVLPVKISLVRGGLISPQ